MQRACVKKKSEEEKFLTNFPFLTPEVSLIKGGLLAKLSDQVQQWQKVTF